MIKVGALTFINALPFFNPFIEKRILFSGDFTFGTPQDINQRLQENKIEIGLVSSATFIQNRDRYILLTNLGIGATKSVKSVCLYSKCDISLLDGKEVAISDATTTSAMLLQVLAEHFWHVAPKLVQAPPGLTAAELLSRYDAALVIGDECLTFAPDKNVKTYDLASEWYSYTQKPFVFGVFATRIDSWMDWPEEVREFHQKLMMAYDYSTAHFHEIISTAQAKSGLQYKVVEEYFKSLDYYLDSNHFQGLEHFASLFAKCGSVCGV